ncbi:MAG: acyl-CoA carboxylase subunit beta, partial [Bdellovibrionaceae bacterium]|nr:acyl-CoA carboxylase subunit beta [Pseudobdellovibrionaceae bacterium]
EARTAKYKATNRLLARERIEFLLDKDSFVETDQLRKHRCQNFGMEQDQFYGDGVVTGYGKIHGRLVVVYSQDFTVLGGSMSKVQGEKICKIMDMALKIGAPIIAINDSGGARIQEGVESLAAYGDIFLRHTQASGVVPQISAVMGPCAGGAAYGPSLTDFIFMVKDTSYLFVTGPDVIKTVTHEEVSKEDLGGAATHTQKSGLAHFATKDDQHCLLMIRELLNFLPSNNKETLASKKVLEKNLEPNNDLENILPDSIKKPYNIKDFIENIVDEAYFFETQQSFAANIVTGFARMDGQNIGIVANQPQVLAGCLNIDASRKAARFIRFCDAFNIPILTLVDVPGFLPGVNQEWNGLIAHGAKLLYAYCEATVPKVTLTIRKAYGGAYIVMSSKHLKGDINLAYPNAEIAVMGAEGAINIISKKEVQQAKKPEEVKKKLIDQYETGFSNPFVAADLGYIDKIILPKNTRKHIVESFDILKNKRAGSPAKKHGNIPL